MLRKFILISSISLLLVSMVACGSVLLDQSNLGSSTQTAFSQAVMETETAAAIQQGNSGHELATAFAYATEISQTSTAQAVLNNASYQATATAIFPVLNELPRYGVNSISGNVAWLHKPVTISLNGPQQFGYANDYPEITAKDFVLAADIKWNTQFGLSGCGFVFHSDGNSAAPNQLMVDITRFAEGSLVFSAMADGNITNMQNYYPWTKDKSFNWQNNSTNRLVIVVRGNLIDLYTNGVRITEVDTTKPPPSTFNVPTIPLLPLNPTPQQLQAYQQQLDQYQQSANQLQAELAQVQRNYYSNKVASLTDGFLGFTGESSSGSAVCTFSNAWLFLINPPSTSSPTANPTFNGTMLFNTPTGTLTPTATLTPTTTPTGRYIFLTPTATAGSGPGHTPTTTAIPPTGTAIPPTGTAIPPTDTAIPPTDTAVVPTATQPPVPTATQPPVPTSTP
jgi:hypothetical protein